MQSHFQATGSDQVATLELELQRLGFRSWYDNKASDLTKAGMKDGVSKTGCFLLFLSTGVLARPFVQVTCTFWVSSCPLCTFVE